MVKAAGSPSPGSNKPTKSPAGPTQEPSNVRPPSDPTPDEPNRREGTRKPGPTQEPSNVRPPSDPTPDQPPRREGAKDDDIALEGE